MFRIKVISQNNCVWSAVALSSKRAIFLAAYPVQGLEPLPSVMRREAGYIQIHPFLSNTHTGNPSCSHLYLLWIINSNYQPRFLLERFSCSVFLNSDSFLYIFSPGWLVTLPCTDFKPHQRAHYIVWEPLLHWNLYKQTIKAASHRTTDFPLNLSPACIYVCLHNYLTRTSSNHDQRVIVCAACVSEHIGHCLLQSYTQKSVWDEVICAEI